MDDFQLTSKQITSLKTLHRLQRDRKIADRVKAVVLLGSGWSVANVAEALLVDETTVRFWWEKYEHGGDKELTTLCYTGKEAFLSEYEKLRKNKGENDPIYFADAVHPQYNSIPAYGWIKRGKDKELKSNGGRKRVNINGAVDIDTLETVTDFSKSINGASSLRLFKKLEAKHPKAEKIHVILDNASYYISKWLKGKLRGSKIILHYLPGYSPNLNLIERLWKFFKKKILYNTYYEKYDDFLAACKSFFRCRTKYRDELYPLLAENFQLYSS